MRPDSGLPVECGLLYGLCCSMFKLYPFAKLYPAAVVAMLVLLVVQGCCRCREEGEYVPLTEAGTCAASEEAQADETTSGSVQPTRDSDAAPAEGSRHGDAPDAGPN